MCRLILVSIIFGVLTCIAGSEPAVVTVRQSDLMITPAAIDQATTTKVPVSGWGRVTLKDLSLTEAVLESIEAHLSATKDVHIIHCDNGNEFSERLQKMPALLRLRMVRTDVDVLAHPQLRQLIISESRRVPRLVLPELRLLAVNASASLIDQLEGISELEFLSDVHLARCDLSAGVLLHLMALPNLRSLSLSGSTIKGIHSLEGVEFSELERLDLSQTIIGRYPLGLKTPNLKSLILSGSNLKVGSLADIPSMPLLEELGISEIDLSDMRQSDLDELLLKFPLLSSLGVGKSQMSLELLQEIFRRESITILGAQDLALTTGQFIAIVEKAGRIPPRLGLMNNALDDGIIPILLRFQGQVTLNLDGNPISQEGQKALRDGLKDVRLNF